MIDGESEYLTPDTLDAYYHAGMPTVQPLSSNPNCWLRIDPPRNMLELFTPEVGDMPDLVSFERIRVDLDEMENQQCFRLDIDVEDRRYEGYSLIAAVVDAMRGGLSFAVAVEGSVRSFKDLLAKRRRLTPEKERGLIGELMVLRHLIEAMGPQDALDTWLGPQAEEHDFALTGYDAEVKTTSAERRVHMISSATQLLPSPDRPLWLISVQLTRAGGSMGSISLSSLIGEVRVQLQAGRDRFVEALVAAGWRDQDEELYRAHYMLRSVPAAYLVDEHFPAITQPRLDQVIPQPQFVGGVTYRVDVSSLVAGSPSEPLDNFVSAI